MQQQVNPLKEASPESISELFDKDPLKLTKQNLTTIVERLRADRLQWKKDDQAKRMNKGAKKKGEGIPDNLQLDLSGLD